VHTLRDSGSGDFAFFEARAKSYGRSFEDEHYIHMVDFEFTQVDNPSPGDWALAGCANYPVHGPTYAFAYASSWANDIDDYKVWVRARAIDDGKCESLPVLVWISIDSTSPTVTNMKP